MVDSSWRQVKSYRSTKLKYETPIIYETLNERPLQIVEWEDQFTQYLPNNRKKPSQRTVFKIIDGIDGIYVAIKTYEKLWCSLKIKDLQFTLLFIP